MYQCATVERLYFKSKSKRQNEIALSQQYLYTCGLYTYKKDEICDKKNILQTLISTSQRHGT